MASAPFPNIYTLRKVADSSSKGCDICYKPTTSVLITPEKQDFFYICAVHLKEKSFCTPIIDQGAVDAQKTAELEARKKKELEEEMERVKKEYAEKQKKKEKEKGDKDKPEADKKDEAPKSDVKVPDDQPQPPAADNEPRVFALQRSFYNQRVDKKRQIELAKRTRERMQNPNFFPTVPK